MEPLFSDDTLHQYVRRNLRLLVWRGPPRVEHVPRMRDGDAQALAAHPGGVAFCNLIVGGMPRFSSEVREEIAGFSQEAFGQHTVTVHGILVPGLVGATVRAFLSTINLIGRVNDDSVITGDLDEVVRALAPGVEGASEAEVRAWLEAARAG